MTYHSIALSDKYSGGRKSGDISITNNNIVFTSDDTQITWPLNEVEFSRGGAGNSLIYIKNSLHPDITLYTNDKKFLKDSGLQGTYSSNKNIGQLKQQFLTRHIIAICVILLLLSPLVVLFMFRGSIVNKIAAQIPVEYEQKAGEQLFKAVSAGYDIIEDSTLNLQLNQMVQPLVEQVKDTTFKFSFYITNDSTVNAFALPGGKVVINSGLIMKSDNWNEIQGVLAHEISHVTLRHHVRGVINKQGVFFVISMLLGGYSDLVAVISGYGSQLESLMYSRKFEFEADNQAFDYMQNAGIDPHGMVTFFDKLRLANPIDINNGFTKILSTHPPTEDRITNLKQREAQITRPADKETAVKLSDFQKQLKIKL